MTKRVQIIGHVKSAADVFLGKVREITVNITDKALRIHDGATVGGIEQARADLNNVNAATVSDDGKMSSSQANDLATTKTAVDAHIGAASGHPVATISANGFMASADKVTLDNLDAAGILALLLTVDGDGSGLDADLLAGLTEAIAATVNTIVRRDASGRAQFATPAVGGDAANKTYVDAEINASQPFPTDTKMLFVQTAAPTGWTKDVDQNNKALRIVSGAVGSGGATAFTSIFGSGKTSGDSAGSGTVGNTGLSIAQLPAHAHDIIDQDDNVLYRSTTGTSRSQLDISLSGVNGEGVWKTGSIGSGDAHTHSLVMNAHNHTLSLDLQYVDVIKATKD